MCPVHTYAQNTNVDIEANNQTVETVLKQITEKTGYDFFFNNKHVDLKRRVTISATGESLFAVLDKVFAGTDVTYSILDHKIVLSTKGMDGTRQTAPVKVTGNVVTSDGESIIGASITEKENPTNGTITDLDGKFSLSVNQGAILVVSYIGYQTKEVKATAGRTLAVTLMEDNELLDEVVVVGYGSMKRSDVTGSISSVNSSSLTLSSQTNAVDAMQGRVAGVNITRNAARPGGSYSINIRGKSSINNSNEPLWVIDGIPTSSSSDASDLNPEDIEKIDILKDASATAIYGSRGANGVVIVTTKRGKEGHFSINYDGYYGARMASHLPDMMDGDEFVEFRTRMFEAQGKSTDRSNSEFFTADEWTRIENKDYTDWIDLVLRTGQQYSNTLTASGGDANGTFALGISQLHEEGTIRDQGYNRYNMHINVDRKFLKSWQAGASMYFTYSKQDVGSYETLRSAYRLPQVAYPYDEDGNLVFHCYRNDNVTNPLMESGEDGEHRENKRYRVFGSIYLQFKPIEGLTLKTQFSPQMRYVREGTYIGTTAKNSNGSSDTVEADDNQTTFWSYVWNNQITYEKTFGKHNLNVSLVQDMQMEQWEYSYQTSIGYPYNSLWYNMGNSGLDNVSKSDTDFQKRTLSSVLGRVQYSFNSRYLLTVSGRYDGSSRLAEGNKWAFFPSAAFAWRASEEEFLKNFDKLSNLKVRVSYGVTGNDAVDIYGTQSGVSQKYYDFNGNYVAGYYKSGLVNKELTWEKTNEINVGVDYGFFNNRINGSIDVYQRTAKDLIMKRNIPITSGWTSIWDNIGKVRNVGVELALNTVNVQSRNFTWESSFTFSKNKNRILDIYGDKQDDVSNGWFIGKPLDSNYDYVFDGIWQESEAEEAAKYDQTPGQVKVKDIDNNGVIDANDKQVLGQRSPKWIGSMTNTFRYKNVDLSIYIYTQQGAQQQDAFMSSFMTFEGDYKQVDVPYWTEENPSNKYPQPGNKGKYYDAMRYVSTSFVRVGSITLGWNLPKSWLQKASIKNVRLYATTNNPFIFTSYKGFDPEWATQNTWGTATGYTTYMFGAKVEF